MNVRHSVVAVSLCLAMAVVGDSRAASAADDLVLALDRADAAAVSKALRSGLSASAPLAYPGEPTIKRTAIQWILGFDASDDPPEQVEARRLAVLKMLFAKGAKLTGHQDEMFATIVQGHEKILRLLLDKGASPSERIYGYTPVELAYREGKLALVELLVARGGQPLSEREKLQIDIVQGARERNSDAIRTAIRAGADINGTDPSGDTPLTAFLSAPIYGHGRYVSLLEELVVEWKANPGKGSEGEKATYPIIELVRMNSFREDYFQMTADLLEQLILRGADVHVTNRFKETALHVAAKEGNGPACRVLLKAGASASATDFQNRTPMSVAKNAETRALLRTYR